ncbi:integrase [Methylorubrum zatmanii]|nr:site-specific integrase [Methylorubrum zatmanii]ARO52732.1 integrase [Methylorubrum zatmanii]
MGKLTAIQVKNLGPGMHGDGDSLYLAVTGKGGRSWVFRYREAGRLRDMGLGSVRDVPLADARRKAADLRRLRADGHDPLEARRAAEIRRAADKARTVTFAEVAEAYIKANRAGWRNEKHAAQWSATLATYAFPRIGSMPVGEVAIGHVLAILEPIWSEKPETATRVRGRIEAVLDAATARGLRTGENPARWRGRLSAILPARRKVAKVEHHPALPFAEVPAFMADLSQRPGMGARALAFAILTAARSGEVRGATWGEIDVQAGVWTVPAERMKAGREHRVPLSEPALAILTGLGGAPDALVFPGTRRGTMLSDMTLTMLLRRMGRDVTAHGFRSSFRDWAGEATSFPREVAEAALAHIVGDKVERAYRRGDALAKRAELMAAWGAYCAGAAIE